MSWIGKSRDLAFRKFQIQQLYDLVKNNEERLYEALAKDMNKPRSEALSGDIAPVLEECLYFLDVSDLFCCTRHRMLTVD